MQALQNVSVFLSNAIIGFVLYIILLRFLMQWLRCDFRNELGQFIITVTNPVVLPMRRLIPSIGRIDTSTLLLAYLVAIIKLSAVFLILYGVATALASLPGIAIWAILELIRATIYIFIAAIFIGIIASWVAPGSYHPILMVARSLSEPLLAPARRIIPVMGGLDLSPMVVLLGLNAILILLGGLY